MRYHSISLTHPVEGIILDIDGVLTQAFTSTPLLGATEALAWLREFQKDRGLFIATATNQAGPLWRWHTGNEKYPTTEELGEQLLHIAREFQIQDIPWYISLADERIEDPSVLPEIRDILEKQMRPTLPHLHLFIDLKHRKPEPEMLTDCANEWGLEPSSILYVGDMDGIQTRSESDKWAAKNAKMQFASSLREAINLIKK